jgi:hypothetical protein
MLRGTTMAWAITILGVFVAVVSSVVMAGFLRTSKARSLTEGEYASTLVLSLPLALGIVVTAVGLGELL